MEPGGLFLTSEPPADIAEQKERSYSTRKVELLDPWLLYVGRMYMTGEVDCQAGVLVELNRAFHLISATDGIAFSIWGPSPSTMNMNDPRPVLSFAAAVPRSIYTHTAGSSLLNCWYRLTWSR